MLLARGPEYTADRAASSNITVAIPSKRLAVSNHGMQVEHARLQLTHAPGFWSVDLPYPAFAFPLGVVITRNRSVSPIASLGRSLQGRAHTCSAPAFGESADRPRLDVCGTAPERTLSWMLTLGLTNLFDRGRWLRCGPDAFLVP